jgi:hypothetical protein
MRTPVPEAYSPTLRTRIGWDEECPDATRQEDDVVYRIRQQRDGREGNAREMRETNQLK